MRFAFVWVVIVCCFGGCTNGIVDAGDAGDIGFSPYSLGGDCPAPTGGPTVHSGDINQDDVWTANGSPHLLATTPLRGQALYVFAKLTLEPCTAVLMDLDQSLIFTRGSLVAMGASTKPIVFRRRRTGQRWKLLAIDIEAEAHLDHVEISAGLLSFGATIPLQAKHLTVRDGPGIDLRGSGFSADSTAVTVMAASGPPIMTGVKTVGTIPPDTNVGNADPISVRGSGTITSDATIRNLGVHYEFWDREYCCNIPSQPGSGHVINKPVRLAVEGSGTLATLTIEPGVALDFNEGAVVTIGDPTKSGPAMGALVAVGSAQKHIVFSGVDGWGGLQFGGTAAPSTRLDFVDVVNAGNDPGGYMTSSCPTIIGKNVAAISIFQQPASAFITNTLIKQPAWHGIDRGWIGDPVDFLPTNTFDLQMGRCKQTYPMPAMGGCPMPAPCP